MSIEEIQKKLDQYFTEKLETYGPTPKGIDCNGAPSAIGPLCGVGSGDQSI